MGLFQGESNQYIRTICRWGQDRIWPSANNRKVAPISDFLKSLQNICAQTVDKVPHHLFRKDNKFIFCNFGPEHQQKETITNPEYFPETLYIQN